MRKRDLVEALEAAITPRTKVIHISHVVFLTGQILPVREICEMARKRGITTIVDGAHSFSHFPFTQDDLQCDYFATSLHKWFVGPIGTGMLFAKRDRIADVWPLMAAPKDMDANIRKFEEIGTHPAAVHNALGEAIAFNRALGIDRKAARLRYLHSLWQDQVRDLPRIKFLTNIDDESNQCGLRLVHIEGTDPGKLSAWLLDKHRIFTVSIGHDDFKGRVVDIFGMRVDGNAAAIIGNGKRTISFQGHFNACRMARHGFVHRVVEDFGKQMVHRARIGAANIHAGPLANGL
jgi:selenocysteine lyase/cysteine desulfurase